MNENVSFRSSFNGFNREDVIGYISGLMDKVAIAEKEAEKLEEDLADQEEELEALRDGCDAFDRERGEWNARRVALEGDCDELKKRCAALEERCAAAERERDEKSVRIVELERRLSECDRASKSSEVKLGAAMLEAKRFSEMLVKEAHDRAGSVYQNASVCVGGSITAAEKLRDQMKALSLAFSQTMGEIMGDTNGLIEAMTSFNRDIRDNGAKFLYQSEFTEDGD